MRHFSAPVRRRGIREKRARSRAVRVEQQGILMATIPKYIWLQKCGSACVIKNRTLNLCCYSYEGLNVR